jgi:dTMP kinase
MAGKFIVFEGIEGAGKTTQIQSIAAALADSQRVLVTREPGGTELGVQLRQMLLHATTSIDPRAELLLYSADRSQHVEEVIKPHLATDGIVLCDRFTDSTIAYQCYGRGLDRELVERANALATNGLIPDLTLWFDVDVTTGLNRVTERGKKDRFEQLAIEFHHRVRQGYQAICSAEHRQNFVRIDANQSIDLIHAEIILILKHIINN